jgi:hypothetical protein
VFRRNVRGACRETKKRIYRPYIDDGTTAAAGQHRSRFILYGEKGALEVDVENSVPFLLWQIGNSGKLPFNARNVHRVVEPSEGSNRVLDCSLNIARNSNIGL